MESPEVKHCGGRGGCLSTTCSESDCVLKQSPAQPTAPLTKCDRCGHESAFEQHLWPCPITKCSGTMRKPVTVNAVPQVEHKLSLPTDSKARKNIPLASGCFDYFPAALAAVAALSKAGNDKHNPGQPLHWARGKSMDHADCILRHLVDRGTVDPEDNIRHSAKIAWRALALLQEELEKEEGAPLPRAAW